MEDLHIKKMKKTICFKCKKNPRHIYSGGRVSSYCNKCLNRAEKRKCKECGKECYGNRCRECCNTKWKGGGTSPGQLIGARRKYWEKKRI